jgi:hypothetical protein
MLQSEKVLIEPSHGLQKSLLLGKPLRLDSQVATHSESVLDLREQVDLVGMAGLLEDLLGPVALLVREDGVGLSGRDGQWARDGGKLILVNERRVSDIANVDTIFVVPDDVLKACKSVMPVCIIMAGVPWPQSNTPLRPAW